MIKGGLYGQAEKILVKAPLSLSRGAFLIKLKVKSKNSKL
jgi:hypothetical protein